MKNLGIVFLLFFALSCSNIDKEIINNPPKNYTLGDTLPQPPVYEYYEGVELPTFPIIALHIVDREYEYHKNDQGFNYTRDAYFEYRLLELYPNDAYEGMMVDATEEYELNSDNYDLYYDSLQAWAQVNNMESILIEDEFPAFTDIEDEAEIMNMTEDEVEEWERLENIATVPLGQRILREELDSLIYGQNHVPYRSAPVVAGIAIWSVVAITMGVELYRLLLIKNRTLQKQNEFYPNSVTGDQGDAFRHCFMAMQMRRYYGIKLATLGTNLYEKLYPNTYYGATYMDLHNNPIGILWCYQIFRGSNNTHIYDWEFWADNTKEWINHDNREHGEFMDEWDDVPPPSDETIKTQGDAVSKYEYIYYKIL